MEYALFLLGVCFGLIREVLPMRSTQETKDVRFKTVSGFREHFREKCES